MGAELLARRAETRQRYENPTRQLYEQTKQQILSDDVPRDSIESASPSAEEKLEQDKLEKLKKARVTAGVWARDTRRPWGSSVGGRGSCLADAGCTFLALLQVGLLALTAGTVVWAVRHLLPLPPPPQQNEPILLPTTAEPFCCPSHTSYHLILSCIDSVDCRR
eukprot:SAG31_NODE_6407_length_2031_cov_1.229814_2_plen_164_part_00